MRHIALTSLAILFTLVFPGRAQGQFSFRRTVGDETENQFQPAIHEATAASGGVISNPNLGASSLNGNFSSRHGRDGQSTGIGGSVIQTTSVTSESRPALSRPSSLNLNESFVSSPGVRFTFPSARENPALSGFRADLPGSDDNSPFRAERIVPDFSSPFHSERIGPDFSSLPGSTAGTSNPFQELESQP